MLGKQNQAHVVLHPAETFDPPGDISLVFTSPPYFSTEVYGGSDEQSARKYSSFDKWLDGFLQPIIKTAYWVLPVGGRLVLNVNDIRQQGKILPLVAETKSLALGTGFTWEDTLVMPIAPLNGARTGEPVLVFRK